MPESDARSVGQSFTVSDAMTCELLCVSNLGVKSSCRHKNVLTFNIHQLGPFKAKAHFVRHRLLILMVFEGSDLERMLCRLLERKLLFSSSFFSSSF